MFLHISANRIDSFNKKINFKDINGIILAEHIVENILISENKGFRISDLKRFSIPVVYISGKIDFEACEKNRINIYPKIKVPFKTMTVTTDYIGPKPVIELHTAGLKCGQIHFEKKSSIYWKKLIKRIN